MVVNGCREGLACVQILTDVREGSAEGAGAGGALQEPDSVCDRHADPEEGGKLAREQNDVRGADAEESRKLAVDPAPAVSRRAHRNHAIATVHQAPVPGGGRVAGDDLFFEAASR